MTADPVEVLLVSWEAWDDWALCLSEVHSKSLTSRSGYEVTLSMIEAVQGVAGQLGMEEYELRVRLAELRRSGLSRRAAIQKVEEEQGCSVTGE